MTLKQIYDIRTITFNAIKEALGEEFDKLPPYFTIYEIRDFSKHVVWAITDKSQLNEKALKDAGFNLEEVEINRLYQVTKQTKQAE